MVHPQDDNYEGMNSQILEFFFITQLESAVLLANSCILSEQFQGRCCALPLEVCN